MSKLVTTEVALNNLAANVADSMAHVGDLELLDMAFSIREGKPLGKYVTGGLTVERFLRGLAFSTCIREIHRRTEVEALENDAQA